MVYSLYVSCNTIRVRALATARKSKHTVERLLDLIVLIRTPSDGRITKALVVKGQILPEDVSPGNVKQN